MERRGWWNVAVGGTIVVVGLIVWLAGPDGRGAWLGACISLGAIALYYYTFGQRARTGNGWGLALQLVLIAGVVVGVWFSPNVLTMQAIMLPLIWTLSGSTRRALILNVVAIVLIFFSFALGMGGSPTDFLVAGLIEGASLGFSIALGLWISSIAEYGNERARLLTELTAAQGELELMNRDAGAAGERERLAREIHDTIAQSLTGLVLLAQRAHAEVRAEDSGIPGAAALSETIALIETMAREALGEARALVSTIAGLPADTAGLGDAIGRLGERFARETGVQVTTNVDAGPLDRELEVVLLRCAQEALANVRKHARASAVSIDIARSGEVVSFVALDNGRGLSGYDPSREQGFGLNGMRDRIGLVGGELTLSEASGGGARLVVTIPAPAPVSA